MSNFEIIDLRLTRLSEKLGAVLTKDRPACPEGLRTFEERRIDWMEHGIRKAIIIQPIFRRSGVDSSKWNVINIAWDDEVRSTHKPKWRKLLVEEQPFETIASSIEDLLSASENNLRSISKDDLT
ncbi:MAG: hypothetical protein AAF587_06325 [Bacteroidota bacterium]